jgi:DNA (cytosine-5)-methyltransferase 1
MITKPKALDLFCKAGGATKGLQRAGFHVTGVDIEPQPRYCGDEFICADALTFDLSGFDFIWASPPCQIYTGMLNHGLTDRSKHPDLIDDTRRLLISAGVPYIIENVQGSPLLNPVMLCGEMFGLRVTRHRFFESNITFFSPVHPKHKGTGIRKQGDGGYYYRVYGHETGKSQWGEAMGIPWMRSYELAQAVPPAYSEYLGGQGLRRGRQIRLRRPVLKFRINGAS